MKPQYTKPQARDLGGYRSMLASGQWDGPPMPGMPGAPGGDELNYCANGSHANTQIGCEAGAAFSANTNPTICSSGSVADGANCAFGGQPGVLACTAGTSPTYWGCTQGYLAAGSCSTGNGVT